MDKTAQRSCDLFDIYCSPVTALKLGLFLPLSNDGRCDDLKSAPKHMALTRTMRSLNSWNVVGHLKSSPIEVFLVFSLPSKYIKNIYMHACMHA